MTNDSKCGCAIQHEPHYDGLGRGYRNYWIKYCSLHASAPELLEALKDLLRVKEGTPEAIGAKAIAERLIAKAEKGMNGEGK